MKVDKRILVVEDEKTLRLLLAKTLSVKGYEVDDVDTIEAAQRQLKEHRYVCAFFDIRLPDGDGLSLLSWAKKHVPPSDYVVMTAEATMHNAIQAVKKGAFEYLVKPFDLSEIDLVIERIEQRRMMAHTPDIDALPQGKDAKSFEIVGRSPAMLKLYKKIGKAASSSYTVLITGESGVGKELVARNLHDFSDRTEGPFVAVNCSAIPHELMESELFGYVKGAFTGADRDTRGLVAEANGGTLFMDEIGELGTKLQTKLLRLLEEGKVTPLGSRNPVTVDVRFVAASNRNLDEMAAQGLLREDLYHRLNVLPIKIPSLRRRPGDVEILARYFIKRYGGGKRISDDACRELAQRQWPGNVRQLQNVIKRALVMSGDDLITPENLGVSDEAPEELEAWIARTLHKGGEKIHERVIAHIESELLRQALESCGWNKLKTARLLGMNRNTLSKKITEYSL